MEQWKFIDEQRFPGYSVSTGGNVKNTWGRPIKPVIGADGYPAISLSNGWRRQTFKLSRLVALAFIPNPDNLPEVNHKDGNKQNCHDWNLEWVTGLANRTHAIQTGLQPCKLTQEQVDEIRRIYIPRHPQFSAAALARKYKVSPTAISHIIKDHFHTIRRD